MSNIMTTEKKLDLVEHLLIDKYRDREWWKQRMQDNFSKGTINWAGAYQDNAIDTELEIEALETLRDSLKVGIQKQFIADLNSTAQVYD